jgi:hypothetical protein
VSVNNALLGNMVYLNRTVAPRGIVLVRSEVEECCNTAVACTKKRAMKRMIEYGTRLRRRANNCVVHEKRNVANRAEDDPAAQRAAADPFVRPQDAPSRPYRHDYRGKCREHVRKQHYRHREYERCVIGHVA